MYSVQPPETSSSINMDTEMINDADDDDDEECVVIEDTRSQEVIRSTPTNQQTEAKTASDNAENGL